jgi:carboxylate-amine ligase
VRTFGVEEEVLVVDPGTRSLLAAGEAAVRNGRMLQGPASTDSWDHPVLTTEIKQEQIEIVGPPCTTLAEMQAAIREGRMMADAAARSVGGRAVALATSVTADLPHLAHGDRYRRIDEQGGLLSLENLTCGLHVHVRVQDREEGVAVLDRIRCWLPVLLALSANSPFWYGAESEFASFRYRAWTRWPTVGPYEVFGSAERYERHNAALLRTGVALDDGMLYFDARLSSHAPTMEVRVADVCLDPAHAAAIAAVVRALVETVSRQWRAGSVPDEASVCQLRTWMWQASRYGVAGLLISPSTGAPAPAGDVVGQLLELVRPALEEAGEDGEVETVVAGILAGGTGARRQREAFARRHQLADVVDAAIEIGTPRREAAPGVRHGSSSPASAAAPLA